MVARQRRGKHKKGSKLTTSNDANTKPNQQDVRNNHTQDVKTNNHENDTAWNVLRNHWTLKVLVMGIPAFLYYCRLYLILQKPHWISQNTQKLRPKVSMEHERQVLIVGTMSSGTSQIATELSKAFGLEVGHETTDSLWEFTRDGTVSWFHGTRFIPLSSSSSPKQELVLAATIPRICQVAYYFLNRVTSLHHPYAAGPNLLGPPEYRCSHLHPNFKKCWFENCERVLKNEFGCATRQSSDDHQSGTNKICQVPFRKTLFQTREPLRIVESLVAKYCLPKTSGSHSHNTTTTPAPKLLLNLFQALHLTQSFTDPDRNDIFMPKATTANTCTHQMAHHVISYYNMLLDAVDAGYIDGMYPVETTPLCEVAELSGLLNSADTVYTPNHDRVKRRCSDGLIFEESPGLIGNHTNQINKGRVKIRRFAEEGKQLGKALDESMKKLYKRLTYYQYPS
mmetsp:Transcript_9017/g.10421  ORF Transcript_9017/g.10421 Transcript_9017/m.10421 type:complete len:452 (+) Transcript_9017:164-1519(+)